MKRKWEITYEFFYTTLEQAVKSIDGILDDAEILWESSDHVTDFYGTKEECFDYLLEFLKENEDFVIKGIEDVTDEEQEGLCHATS